MAPWSEGNVTANGSTIHYYRTGGPKPSILLLHGITDNGLCWTRVAGDLADRYDLVMTDARGHGRSDRLAGGFSVPQLAADAAGVIRGLGLERPVVFGHSMGAITAAALAAEYPDLVSAVILEDPPLLQVSMPLPAEFIAARRSDLAALRSMSPAEREAVAVAQNPGWHRTEIEPWAQSKVEVDLAVLDQFGTFDTAPWRETLAHIRCPGLLITGDPTLMAIVTPEVAREAVALWPNGEVSHIAGAGHCIHRDRYAETLAAVDAFLERQAAS